MPLPKDEAWFPTKVYGYGWGIPSCWQGWVVLIGYVIALVVGAVLFAGKSVPFFVAYTLGCSVVLVAICAWKGEAPRWRWGDE
jgi:hypothetical protein